MYAIQFYCSDCSNNRGVLLHVVVFAGLRKSDRLESSIFSFLFSYHFYQLYFIIIISIFLVVGSMTVRHPLDRGRRHSLMIFAAFHTIAALTTAIATSYATLLWGRFISGMSIGGLVVCVTVYISEIAPPHLRGSLG